MRHYINKDSVLTINTYTTSDELVSDGRYILENSSISDEDLAAKYKTVKMADKYYYNNPTIVANNFTKEFKTEEEMYEWISVNLNSMVLVNSQEKK